MTDDRGYDPRYDPAFQRGWGGAEPDASARPAPSDPDRIVVIAEPVAPEPDGEAPGEHRGGLNPFLIALAALAVLLIVAGVWMASRVSDGYAAQGPSTQVDYALLQILAIASPVTALLGVATGIGVLFVFAVRWGR